MIRSESGIKPERPTQWAVFPTSNDGGYSLECIDDLWDVIYYDNQMPRAIFY